MKPIDMVTEQGIRQALEENPFGLQVTVVEETDSTNTQLKRLAREGAPSGTVLIARRQVGGRGRLGRRFESPEGGLYMSLLLRPDLPANDMLYLTTLTAVAVNEAVEAVCGVNPGIKWVNDLYLDGRKICGILAEAGFSPDGSRVDYTVIGIGVNVYAPEGGYPEEIRDIAGALYAHDDREEGRRNRLAAAILEKIMKKGHPLDKISVSRDYKARSVVIGKWVTVCRGDAERDALVLDIDEENHLVVRYGDGAEEALSTGEIRVKLHR
ncbi:MAG: biotin--[acetyl-CoA-carboxylase] ligase [Ruminococcaceae bacterium]|nr:biotin--[acetyl-CoA-carboxylase] ligase [Oscillospiraceae bacterium]